MSHIRSRFSKPADKKVVSYTTSLPFDCRLYPQDIRGSIAHARMLAAQNIISQQEAIEIEDGLVLIQQELDSGNFVFKPELEDIHMAIESRLFELKGRRSRQIIQAVRETIRLPGYAPLRKDSIKALLSAITDLQNTLIDKAEANIDVIIHGCTHLQHAQPVFNCTSFAGLF